MHEHLTSNAQHPWKVPDATIRSPESGTGGWEQRRENFWALPAVNLVPGSVRDVDDVLFLPHTHSCVYLSILVQIHMYTRTHTHFTHAYRGLRIDSSSDGHLASVCQ